MGVFLHKGSWREFKIFLALHLKGCVKHWDSHLSRKIFMILQGEEIRKRFLSAFPPLTLSEKLHLSLDNTINPIEILEELSHREGCHPGRLTLDPERYNRAWSEDRDGDPGYGYEDPIPPHMRARFLYAPTTGKHRLLDIGGDIDYSYREELVHDIFQQRHLPWGLQDMYFLGGVPLEYWCNGDSMGMHVRSSLPCSETYQWPGTAFRAQTYEEGGGGEDFSLVTECCRTYCFSRMPYLPTEVEWGGERGQWVTGQSIGNDRAGQDHVHFAYIKYIQEIEDFDKAVECSVFGERIRELQLSDTPQENKQQAALFWGSPKLPPI